MTIFYSPAKINLFLQVREKRQDQYHALASLFQAISLCDELTIELAANDHWTSSHPNLPLDEFNLIIQALHLFREKTDCQFKFAIHLEKKIPLQAGLGGGSSNAATLLWAVNQLCNYPVELTQLVNWASLLGSDVPFFLSQGTAYCTGRGEIVCPLPPLPTEAVIIVTPSQGLATAEVYQHFRAPSFLFNSLAPPDPIKAMMSFYEGKPHYFNDLEASAFSLMPALALLKKQLQAAGFKTVLLSGSGSSFFCLGQSQVPIDQVLIDLNCQIQPVHFLKRSVESWYDPSTST